MINIVSCYGELHTSLNGRSCIQPVINRKAHETRNSTRERTRQKPALLPGLPNDVAIACLIRVPRAHHNKLRVVCKTWQRLLSGNLFYSLRKHLGLAEEWLHVIKQDHNGKISWTAFDPVFATWHPLPSIPEDFSRSNRFGCAVLNGCHLYLFGGKGRSQGSTRRAVLYNACTRRWHRVPDMIKKRSFVGSCVMNDCIYVAGGECEGIQRVLPSCEVYDPERNCWKIVADMGTGMVPYVGVVYDGKWFLKGLGPHREIQCKAYVSETGSWVPVREGMVVGLCNPNVVANGKLYTLDCGDSCKVKVFDERLTSWNTFMECEKPLGNSEALKATGLVALNGKLCIVRNNMSVSMVDVSGTDKQSECKPHVWEHIGKKSHTQNRLTKLWSSLAGKGGLKSQIMHCQVLQA